MNISSLLRAAALGLSLTSASMADATTIPESGPTAKAPESSFLLTPDVQTAASCRMRILSYFSDENLKEIDASLAGVRTWFVAHNESAPNFSEYSAGTKDGLAYLAKDPGNVIAVIELYKNHVDMMRESAPKTVAAFEAEQGDKLAWLSRVSDSALQGIAQQVATHCHAAPSANGPV